MRKRACSASISNRTGRGSSRSASSLGHQAEWVWLLKGFERITGCPTGKQRAALLESALRYRDATGCLVDEGDAQGNIVKATRRCWPQTEIIKAFVAQAESGVEGAADEARAALMRLDKYYLQHPVKGGWYDQFDGEGTLAGRYDPGVILLSYSMRSRRSRTGARRLTACAI